METNGYLKLLVEKIHSAAVATIGSDGHPQIRTVDMMLYDEKGVYFLTARGKAFYAQLTEQRFVAVSATKDKSSVSLRGKVEDIGNRSSRRYSSETRTWLRYIPGRRDPRSKSSASMKPWGNTSISATHRT